jgi:hypothetical protein
MVTSKVRYEFGNLGTSPGYENKETIALGHIIVDAVGKGMVEFHLGLKKGNGRNTLR